MQSFRSNAVRIFLTLTLAFPLLAAAGTLRVLAWPGYADADVVKAFEQRTGSRVELTLIASDSALWELMSRNSGGAFDVFAVNTAELQRYIREGLVVPVDLQRIPNRAAQQPRFRKLEAIPGLVHDDKVFAIPYTFAEMGLIYDRNQLAAPPESINALWDPRFRGKVLAFNDANHNFSLAAQSLGRATPFALAEHDWRDAVERLIALRRNVLTFYTQPEESVELFRRQRVAVMLANYGSQQLKLLEAAGADVGYAIPREGALAWLDCWAISRGVRDKALAEAWIDFLLEPGPGQVLTNRQGLANTTSPVPRGPEGAKLVWLEPPESIERRTRLWARIISGDGAGKVLAR